MKHIYLNLKRFDVSPLHGGVNRIAPAPQWASSIVQGVQDALCMYADTEFVAFFPEAHLLNAVASRSADSPLKIGCQGVFRCDTEPGGNFGAFTTSLPAHAARELGCTSALIGHCEERRDKAGIMQEAGVTGSEACLAVGRILNQEVRCAQQAGLSVVLCIGETEEEHARWQDVLKEQLDLALEQVDLSRVVIAYEPVWSIGPGKQPASGEHIAQVAQLIHSHTGNIDVVYGGGLKHENAGMLAAIPEIAGGLIALTRFSGEIGFYPDEYLDIVSQYLKA